jgi:type II secretory pathway component GspD/PulD (secretin)
VYGTRSVIVTANAENMSKVEDLLTQLDSETGHGRKNFTYQVKEARVVDLVNVMRDFVNQSMSRTGRGQLPITLVANEATNTMLVSCTQSEYDELLPIIELLDRPPEAETGRYARAYKLKYSDPGSVNNIIQNAFQERGRLRPEDRVTAAVDWGTSMLIVVANEENHVKVASLLEEMDQAEVGGMEVRQIRVENAGAQEVAQALQQTFIHGQRQVRGASTMSIVNPPGTQVILVRSDARTFEEIKQVVAELDQADGVGGGDVRVVVLENVDAGEAKTILEDYLRKPGGGRGGQLVGDVRVTAAESLNAVVISGPSGQIEQAAAVVKEFDLDPTETGGAPQVIQIEHGDAVQIAETLSRMFTGQGGRGRGAAEAPVIEGMAGTNTLLVKARPADMSQIRAIVASLDTEEMAEGAANIEIIRVAQGIDVVELAASIERAINEAERQRVQGQRGARVNEITIEPDTRTNALILSGTKAQARQVRELVSTLENMKPVGPSRILIRKPAHRSATEIKQVLDELIEEGSSSGSSGRRSSGSRRPRRSSGRGR